MRGERKSNATQAEGLRMKAKRKSLGHYPKPHGAIVTLLASIIAARILPAVYEIVILISADVLARRYF